MINYLYHTEKEKTNDFWTHPCRKIIFVISSTVFNSQHMVCAISELSNKNNILYCAVLLSVNGSITAFCSQKALLLLLLLLLLLILLMLLFFRMIIFFHKCQERIGRQRFRKIIPLYVIDAEPGNDFHLFFCFHAF